MANDKRKEVKIDRYTEIMSTDKIRRSAMKSKEVKSLFWQESSRGYVLPKFGFLLSLLAIWSFTSCNLFANADWIDPDTPEEAYTTYTIDPIPHIPHVSKGDADAAKSTKSTNSTKTSTKRTETPTMAPTSSTAAPTVTPTTAPTQYPTSVAKEFKLVFSDEFNTPGREFGDGKDPRWTALDKNDYTNDALHYYSPENVATDADGHLVIQTAAADTEIVGFDDVKMKKTHVTKHFRSAMLQTWNKFCFTGGVIEAQVILPGKANTGGLWPAFWILGNLARHTYVGSSEHIWPWSSLNCTAKSASAQKVSGCNQVSHYGMAPRIGRGAPEIDIFEVQPGNIKANNGVFLKSPVGQPFMSASFQVAPGRSVNRPGGGEWPGPDQWYSDTRFGRNTSLNILFYGAYNHFNDDTNPLKQDYWSDAISYNRQLDQDYFENPHVYRLEWEMPNQEHDGYLNWFLDGELVSSINGTGIKKAGLGSEISSEPSYIILNTAVSKQWGFPHECPTNCPCKNYDCNSKKWSDYCGFSSGFCEMMKKEPVKYKIDWVRVYQDPNNPAHKVGCSTPERPTRKWIKAHEKNYKTETDVHPLKGVARGLGSCDQRAAARLESAYALLKQQEEQFAATQSGAQGTLPSNATTTPLPAASKNVTVSLATINATKAQILTLLPQACGGAGYGQCTSGNVCACDKGWTGPHCLAHDGYDAISYDEPDTIGDVGFVAPSVLPGFMFLVLGVLVLILACVMFFRRRMEGWEPVPDIDVKKTYIPGAQSAINHNNLLLEAQHKRGQSV